MEKDKALELVKKVKLKWEEDYVQEVLTKVEDYIKSQENFSYRNTMKFIQEFMNGGKMGGINININKSLVMLKNHFISNKN